MGNVFSFVYVDYGVSEDKLDAKIEKKEAFRGYKIISRSTIGKKQLDNGENLDAKFRKYFEGVHLDKDTLKYMQNPYCFWYIFERLPDVPDTHNPKRFSLLYLSSEAVSAYLALYVNNNIAPKILSIIQPGHGFGGNFTDFTYRKALLAQAVFSMKKRPKYVVNGGYYGTRTADTPNTPREPNYYLKPIWPEYAKNVAQRRHPASANSREKFFVLWGKSVKGK
jgi:hypothetical protein